jgi:hypothetical protein
VNVLTRAGILSDRIVSSGIYAGPSSDQSGMNEM